MGIRGTTEDILIVLYDMKVKQGKSQWDLIQYLKEQHGFAPTTQYEYIRKLREYTQEIITACNVDYLTDSVNFLTQQIGVCMAKGEKKLALSYQKELNKITGLYKENITISSNDLKVVWGGQNNKDVGKNDDENFFG